MAVNDTNVRKEEVKKEASGARWLVDTLNTLAHRAPACEPGGFMLTLSSNAALRGYAPLCHHHHRERARTEEGGR